MIQDIARPTAAAIIALYKGPVYRERQPETWRDLIADQASAQAYCAVIGLDLFVDEAEGFAFLRQADDTRADTADENAEPLPRLIPRHNLSFHLSVLLVLLRKRLLELDAGGDETRLIVTRDALIEDMRLFMRTSENEAKTVEQIERLLSQAEKFGLIRPLKKDPERVEVRRIIKALVDAEWLAGLNDKLDEYRAFAGLDTDNNEKDGS